MLPRAQSCAARESQLSTLLRCSAAGFSVLEAHLAQRLSEAMSYSMGCRPSAAETRSWERSLPVVAADLKDAGLDGVEMLIEYRLPLTSKRADIVLAGISRATGDPTYLVLELKQWTEASIYEGNPSLVSVAGYQRSVSHPLDQVGGYVDYLTDLNGAVAAGQVRGVAYLHNATEMGIHDLRSYSVDGNRLFTGEQRGALRDYLADVFAPTSGAEAADSLLAGRVAPSKQLLKLAADEVQRREMFVLLDEQRDAYHHVLHAVNKARRSNTKTAVVIAGGPGSGKSVIALSLMGELARQGRSVIHATGSRSFTTTLRKVAGARAPRVQKAFQYFNSFMDAEPNELDCLILDEAHRIRETSVNRWTKASLRTDRPQIDELLAASRTPVFLLDQDQVVRPGELGTVADIEAAARAHGMEVEHIDLDAQFRCGGSLEYVQWVQRLLGLADGDVGVWSGDEDFEVRLAESPQEMEDWLASRLAKGYNARMAAGYCWRWSDPRPDGSLVPDVQIGDWGRPWNLKGDRSVGGAPAAALWATDPAGFGQVGCVYTAQGFEYDYAGVIIGPDLVWRDGRWRSVREANRDPDFKNRARVHHDEFDRLVRNVYKVLLTRGLRGVSIYSTDPATREHLRSLVPT